MAAMTALALAAASASLYTTLSQKKPKAPTLADAPPVPAAPDPAIAAAEKEAALTRRKGKAVVAGGATPGFAGTLLTGPSGLATPAAVRKTLLGA